MPDPITPSPPRRGAEEFAERVLEEQPWAKQREVMRAVQSAPRVTVRSGHGVGKTRCAAALAVWFLAEHTPSLVVTTAPTFRQVRDVLWPELRRLWARAVRDEEPTSRARANLTEIRVDEQRRAFGFSTNEPQRLQGMHCENILVIVDEAGGVEERLFDAVQGLLTSRNARLLLVGNPILARGFFHTSHRVESGYTRLHISCLESPNVVARRCVIPGLVTQEWVEEQGRQWGVSSPIYRSRVLGEFPQSPHDALIPDAWIEAALRRALPPAGRTPMRLGVDVARHGDDRTALILRDDDAVRRIIELRVEDLIAVGERVLDLARREGLEGGQVFLDTCGMGLGVADWLHRRELHVQHVNFAAAARSRDFRNLRAQAYWSLRAALDPGAEQCLALPPEARRLADECKIIRYAHDASGIRIVAKEDLARELGHSPDLADALALTFADLAPRPLVWHA